MSEPRVIPTTPTRPQPPQFEDLKADLVRIAALEREIALTRASQEALALKLTALSEQWVSALRTFEQRLATVKAGL